VSISFNFGRWIFHHRHGLSLTAVGRQGNEQNLICTKHSLQSFWLAQEVLSKCCLMSVMMRRGQVKWCRHSLWMEEFAPFYSLWSPGHLARDMPSMVCGSVLSLESVNESLLLLPCGWGYKPFYSVLEQVIIKMIVLSLFLFICEIIFHRLTLRAFKVITRFMRLKYKTVAIK
jgi:hypothetical protein